MTWSVERVEGPASTLHRPDPAPDRRRLRILRPTGPALVLGSAQPDSVVDTAALARLGVARVRRATGGGAVLVTADDPVWVDVDVPAGDPLWDDDVGRAFHWLGEAWAEALRSRGIAPEVHRGRAVTGTWGRLVCFAGLGAGEVLVNGRKSVGMAQRRVRSGARFQCALARRWAPGHLVELLALGPGERRRALADLGEVVWPVGDDADAVVAAFVEVVVGRGVERKGG